MIEMWMCGEPATLQTQAEAVFIDNVTDGSTKKRQRQLGQNAPRTEWASRMHQKVYAKFCKLVSSGQSRSFGAQ